MPLGASVEEAAIVMMSALPGLSTEAALSLARIKRTHEALSVGLRAGAMARSRGCPWKPSGCSGARQVYRWVCLMVILTRKN
jgi:hypothetical protein